MEVGRGWETVLGDPCFLSWNGGWGIEPQPPALGSSHQRNLRKQGLWRQPSTAADEAAEGAFSSPLAAAEHSQRGKASGKARLEALWETGQRLCAGATSTEPSPSGEVSGGRAVNCTGEVAHRRLVEMACGAACVASARCRGECTAVASRHLGHHLFASTTALSHTHRRLHVAPDQGGKERPWSTATQRLGAGSIHSEQRSSIHSWRAAEAADPSMATADLGSPSTDQIEQGAGWELLMRLGGHGLARVELAEGGGGRLNARKKKRMWWLALARMEVWDGVARPGSGTNGSARSPMWGRLQPAADQSSHGQIGRAHV